MPKHNFYAKLPEKYLNIIKHNVYVFMVVFMFIVVPELYNKTPEVYLLSAKYRKYLTKFGVSILNRNSLIISKKLLHTLQNGELEIQPFNFTWVHLGYRDYLNAALQDGLKKRDEVKMQISLPTKPTDKWQSNLEYSLISCGIFKWEVQWADTILVLPVSHQNREKCSEAAAQIFIPSPDNYN